MIHVDQYTTHQSVLNRHVLKKKERKSFPLVNDKNVIMSAYALNLFPEISGCFSTPSSTASGIPMTRCIRPPPVPSESPSNSLDATISDAAVDPQFLPGYFMSAVTSNLKVSSDAVIDSTSVICNKVIFFITVTKQGSTYVVKRTLSQFNDFRNNLLHEWNNEISLPELPPTPWDEVTFESERSGTNHKKAALSHQTCHLVDHPGHSSFTPISGPKLNIFGSGFTKIRNMFNGYIPILNNWLTGVCEYWPTSTALGNFLWEPSATFTKSGLTTSASTASGLCLLEPIKESDEDDLEDDSNRSLQSKSITSQTADVDTPRARSRTCSSEISDEDSSVLLSDPYGVNNFAILNHWQSSW